MGSDSLQIHFSLCNCLNCHWINVAVAEYCLKCNLFIQCQAHHHIHHAGLSISHKNDIGSLAHYLDRLVRRNLRSGRLNRKVKSLAAGQFLRFRKHVHFFSVDHAISTKFQRFIQPLLHDIYYIYMGNAACFKSHHGYQSDASCAKYDCRLSCLRLSLLRRMESYCKRLDQRAFQRAYIIRKLEAQIRLMGYIFLEYAVYRRCSKEDYVRTKIIFSFPAEFAFAASLSWLQRHAVANLQMRNIPAYFYDSASRLMSQHERRLYHIIADSAHFIIMHIASADSHIFHLYQYLIIGRYGYRTLLYFHLGNTGHDCCFHSSIHCLTLLFPIV